MNESDKFFVRRAAVLDRFLELVRRALLEEADVRRMPNLFDSPNFPKPRVMVVHLEETVKNGRLPIHVAEDIYDRIEKGAKNYVCNLRRTRGDSDSRLAQVRAKCRNEELEIKSEDEIEREASKWVNNLWNEACEHQAAV